MPNLTQGLPDARTAEIVEVLAGSPTSGTRIERITSAGHASPPGFWYDQDEHEWVAVLAGWGDLEWADGRVTRLAPGDHVTIPAHVKHRVAATAQDAPTVWVAVFWTEDPPARAG